LGFSSYLFPSGFPTNILYYFVICLTCATGFARVILLALVTVRIFDDECKLRSPLSCSYLSFLRSKRYPARLHPSELNAVQPLLLGKQTLRGCIPRSEYTAELCYVSPAALGTNTHVSTFPQREMIIEGKGEADGS
jgi:hypothetical protein